MRCILCGKIIDKEIKISTFFKFDYYCDDCERIIEPKYTIFPLREGYIGKYYYLYENKRDNNSKYS